MNDKLQKLLAHAGLGSRRELETWISAGRVTVNGRLAKLGDRASVTDKIAVDGKPVRLAAQSKTGIKALIYHKPEGQICSRKDPQGRPTVFENLPKLTSGRWVAVGRLDLNTSGLLLFTDNGDLANRLMHPSSGLEREYLVRIRGKASQESIQKLTVMGVKLEGKLAKFESVFPADLAEQGSNHWYRVVICEGRYREVRRMWDSVGHKVSRLKRIRYGSIKLSRDLRQGQSQKMAPKQLEKLVTKAGLASQFEGQLYSGTKTPKPQKSPARSKHTRTGRKPSYR